MTFEKAVAAGPLAFLVVSAAAWAAQPQPQPDADLFASAQALFQPLPIVFESRANPVTARKVELGQMLYYEPRLSKSNVLSCSSCHSLATYGVDNLPTSVGHRWAVGKVNAPTTLNAAGQFAQFWDGRAPDVEEQAKGPILNPREMGLAHAGVAVENVASIPGYVARFKQAFPDQSDPVTYDNIARAIGDFERTLATPGRFDRFLSGDQAALSAGEKRGLAAFIDVGCPACHRGALLGGRSFDKFGIYRPYEKLTGSRELDAGRYEQTRREQDRFVFKVPQLRNVERTYPYFHDGSVWSLGAAIRIMGDAQLDTDLSAAQVADISVFLMALTGEIPVEARTLPVLPPAGAKTQRPDVN